MVGEPMAKEFWKRRQWKRRDQTPEPAVFPPDDPLPQLTAEQVAEASVTPRTFQFLLDRAPGGTPHHRPCSHLESTGIDVSECERQAVIICGGCGHGTCLDAFHAYCRFGTLRDGVPHERSGAKFHYYCRSCHSFLCTTCLGLRDEYPCPPEQLERHVFRCTRCGAELNASRLDHADMDDFVDALADLPSSMLRLSPP
jgi:hypothetical protein